MGHPAIAIARTSTIRTAPLSPSLQQESICSRCGGFMVHDCCMDFLNSAGELAVTARRCVQCGEIIDPVILRNRQVQSTRCQVMWTKRIIESQL